jgi:hypothetical protein
LLSQPKLQAVILAKLQVVYDVCDEYDCSLALYLQQIAYIEKAGQTTRTTSKKNIKQHQNKAITKGKKRLNITTKEED